MTSMGQFIEAGRREPTTMVSKTPQSTPMKTPKKKKNAPPPLNLVPAGDMLKLVPDGAEYAIPTQREKNESTRHKKMEDMMYDAIAEGNESAAPSFVSVDSEKIEKRPKSPGKKFFDFFKGGASSPKAPETPEIPATYKASKILGDESLGRKKGKAIAAAQKKRKKDGFDFKCSGPTPNIGGDSFDAPTDQEIRMTADHAVYSPTDFEIRKVGGRGTIVPMLSTQRTVSDSSTVVGARVGTIKSSEAVAKHSSEIFLRTKSLQYMNDSLPPTPPSKESIKTRDRQDSIKNRALVTDYPPRSISTVPEDEDSSETPNTAILASPTPLPKTTPLPKGLTQFTHNDYADLVLNNKSSIVSLQGSISETESVCSSMHNLTRNTSTEMLIDSYLDSDDNVVMKSSSNNSVVTAYEGRLGSLTPSVSSLRSNISRLSSRWSDGSMLSQIAQVKMLQVPEMLRPGFYSPASFHLAGFKPSRNVSFHICYGVTQRSVEPSCNTSSDLHFLLFCPRTSHLPLPFSQA
jgi:hypothetical protein